MSRCNARSALGLSAGLLALASGLAASPAHASDECGVQTGTTVTCTSAGNFNSAGITYAATRDLTLKIAPDVIIDTSATHARALTIGGTRNTSNVTIDAAGSSIVTAGATAVTVATGTGNLTLDFGSIKTTGDNAAGINAATASGAASVSAGAITTTGATAYGIYARGVAVSVSDAESIATTGANATAVLVASTTGDVDLDLGTISTSGNNAVGINAASTSGNIAVAVESVTTTGTGATAILTSSTSGAISVTNSGPISTSGASAYGIYARGPAGVTVDGRGSVTTTGASATAVLIASTTGDVNLDLGDLSTAGDNAPGVNVASSAGNIAISTQSVTTTGEGSSAILAQATTGTVSVTNDGAISTGGSTAAYGIYARGTAGVTIAGQGSITTTGDGANAIDVISAGGAADVTQGTVSTSGANAIGIRVSAKGDAKVAAGNVTTTGADSIAISALSSDGAASVSLSGAVRSADAIGVAMNAKTGATLSVAAGGSLDGAGGAVVIVSGTGAVIDNAGSIGPSGAATLAAATITASGGPVTINNAGTITGNLVLGAAADVVTNTGVFNALGNSDFKGGNDLFDNRGTFNVARSVTAPATVTLTALETFRNAGTVDFRNGHIGDQLLVKGSYASANGRLYLDVDPTNFAGSDLLQVSGGASGNTVVTLNRIGDKGFTLNYGTPIVKVGAASDAGAFTLDPAQQDVSGLIGLGLKYDAGNLSYNLVGIPGDAAYRTLGISAGVRALWTQSADAWSARMQQVRDLQLLSPNQTKPGIWGQFIGQRQTRDYSETATAFGVSRPIDIGYVQDEIGGQLGVDFRPRIDGTPVVGITGGYVHSRLSYDRVSDRVTFDDVNLGAYVGYRSGALFFNLLGKYDLYWARNSSVSGGYSSKLDGSSYGVQAEFGGRLGGKALFFEPHVSVAASHGQIDDFAVTAGRFSFDDPDGLKLKAGGRVGSSFDINGRAKGAFFVRADYVDDIMGKDRVVFASGGTNAALEMDAASPYGEGAVGLTVIGKSGLGLSIEGRYAKGGDSDGAGGRITLSSAF